MESRVAASACSIAACEAAAEATAAATAAAEAQEAVEDAMRPIDPHDAGAAGPWQVVGK
jgi:hypothetical protein